MKVWEPEDSDAHFELTPMIDVVFLLIAFFMVLTNFITRELIALEIPIAEEASVPDEQRDRQFISIQADGTLFFGAMPIDYDELAERLVRALDANPSMRVYLRADATAPHRHINDVMAACAEAGIFDLIFATNQI
jgi:biopolymer transport protein ExbD